jgi:hypothetical protein
MGTHSTIMSGVFARDDGAVGPLKAATVVVNALSWRPVSAFMARKGDGGVFLYVALEHRPAIYIRYGTAFSNHFTGTRANPTLLYPWRFAQFGDAVFLSNWGDGLWRHALGTLANCTQITAAPSGVHIATIEPGFLMLGHLNDSAGEKPSSLRWSAINDATDWPTVGTSDAASKQSDEQELPAGGRITGILPSIGGVAGAVFTERSIFRVEYVGAPAVFSFREIIRGIGNITPNGAISVDGVAYFVSDTGFMRFDGQGLAPIGQGRVSRTFLAEVDRENLHRVYVAHDQARKILVWAYPTSAATGGNPNKWLVYSYAADRWSACDDSGIASVLVFPAMSDRINVEQIDGYLGGPDSLSISFDSATVGGGTPLLAGFDASYRYVQYTGANLAARVETGEADAQGRRVYVSGIRPLTDAGTLTAQVGHRVNFTDSPAYTTGTATGADAICPQRIATRYARARVDIPAGTTWTYLQGADVMLRAEGKR